MLLFSFSIFSDCWQLKIENENNSTKTLTTEALYIGLESIELVYKYRHLPWLAGTTFTGTNFHGPKPVQTT